MIYISFRGGNDPKIWLGDDEITHSVIALKLLPFRECELTFTLPRAQGTLTLSRKYMVV